jgi:hypothetical protein
MTCLDGCDCDGCESERFARRAVESRQGMTAETLSDLLRPLAKGTRIVFEGEGDMCWTVRNIEQDENGSLILLRRGHRVPITVDR